MTRHTKAARGPRPGSFHKLLRKAKAAHALDVRLRDMAMPAMCGGLTLAMPAYGYLAPGVL